MKELKLMTEYQCSPLWLKVKDGSFENISIDSLGLNENLKNEILEWDEKFQSTLNLEDPLNSGFKS